MLWCTVGAKVWTGFKTVSGGAAVLSLLQKLGEGYRHLCMYRCTVRLLLPLTLNNA